MESHHTQPEPLDTDGQLFQVLSTEKWHQWVVVGVDVKFQANEVARETLTGPGER